MMLAARWIAMLKMNTGNGVGLSGLHPRMVMMLSH